MRFGSLARTQMPGPTKMVHTTWARPRNFVCESHRRGPALVPWCKVDFDVACRFSIGQLNRRFHSSAINVRGHDVENSPVARELALADDRRIRILRRGNLHVVLGSLLFVGAWLTIPFGMFLALTASLSGGSLALLAVGAIFLLASIVSVVGGIRVRRQSARDHAPATALGKADPAFDGDRKTLPTGGVPLSWIVPGT